MCGILGYISDHIDSSRFVSALQSLEHRGPDNDGFELFHLTEKSLALGHKRLSILDLSEAGKQPMSYGRVSIVYNGEVYNYRELRDKYLRDVELHSNSDTEVILHLYIKLGENFVKELNGDFAIALLDEREQKLRLYRDRFGVKPLYLYRSSDQIAFSSEIKAFKSLGLRLTLDKNELRRYFVYKYTPGQRTLFKEVDRIKPGSVSIIDLKKGEIETRQYWELDYSKKFSGPYSDAKSEIRELMSRSVQRRLIADVPIANYLSGGLDSSIIAYHLKDADHTHYCAVKSKDDLKLEGTSSDGKYAKLLAREWNLHLEEISIGKSQLSKDLLRKAVYACDDLIADGSTIPAMLIAKQAANSYKVVLSGMGADEIFYGYNGHFLFQLSAMLNKIPGASSFASSILKKVQPGKGSFKAYKRYLKKWGENLGGKYSTARYSIVGDVNSAISLSPNPPELEFLFSDFISTDQTFESLQAFEMENFLVKNNHYLDRTSMAYGLESRVPYLDHELVSFVTSLPSKWKMSSNLNSKKILKDAYATELPSYITKRRKAGFGMPLRSIFSSRDVMNEMIDKEFLADMEIVNLDVLNKLITNHINGVEDQSALLFSVIAFQEWYGQMFTSPEEKVDLNSLINS